MPALEARIADFRAADAVVLGISGDSMFSHDAWASREGISYPLLSDIHHAVSQAYGVHNPERNCPRRATFILDRNGVVRFKEVYGPGQLPSPARLLEALADIPR